MHDGFKNLTRSKIKQQLAEIKGKINNKVDKRNGSITNQIEYTVSDVIKYCIHCDIGITLIDPLYKTFYTRQPDDYKNKPTIYGRINNGHTVTIKIVETPCFSMKSDVL
jgi:hypothetical protein